MHLVITEFVFNGQRTKADYWSHSSFSFSSLKYIFMCPCTQTFDLFFSLYNYFLLSFMVVEIIVHGEKWSRSLVNVKEVNKKAEMYVGRLLITCPSFVLCSQTMHRPFYCNASIG